MKSSLKTFIFLILTLPVPSLLMAQKSTFTTNSGLTIGFGLGGTYQKSDIANSIGAGFDFTLGHILGNKEGAFLRPDWKFRFLMGRNRAYDHRINTDGTFSNIQYDFFNYDLELGLTLNRLRERTRIVITGFGGAGIVHGRTFADLYDDTNTLYDYSTIDPAKDRALVYADLLGLSDDNFETRLTNKAAIMPTLGLFIGYQFTRSFSMGAEYKTSFSLSEDNTAWGINIDNKIAGTSRKDRNNYVSLVFRWSLGGRSSYYIYPVERTSYPPVTPFTDTVAARTITRDTAVTRTTRTISPTTPPTRRVPVTVTPGVSAPSVVISDRSTETLRTGASEDNVTIVVNRPVTRKPLPEIRFINPPEPVTVQHNTYRINAQTRNIISWNDVEVKINNNVFSNFSLTPEGLVTTNIGLTEGLNTIEIKGKNESGETSASTTITYERRVITKPAPVVKITLPAENPYSTYNPTTELRARIENISSQKEIKVLVNSMELNNFDFDPGSGTLNASIRLKEGSNEVKLTAVNESGSDSGSRTVIKETRPCPQPAVSLTEPALNQKTTGKQTLVFKAKVTNIVSANQLEFTVNGNSITSFSFDGRELSYNATLKEGVNTFSLIVTNDCGRVSLKSDITYIPNVEAEEKPCGVRINPGNAAWQFCLVTPTGTFNRNSLKNESFSYSGPATSLFFMPTAGGGEAIVNGQPYIIRPGQYYLFTGRLKVNVSTKNPGSMGQWSVCIESEKPPVSGNGNNRPNSPCEVQQSDSMKVSPAKKTNKY